MAKANLRQHSVNHRRTIGGITYVSIGVTATELGWSPDAIKNWISARQKFTAGNILQLAIINGRRWFTLASVRRAKAALRRHGRLVTRRTY